MAKKQAETDGYVVVFVKSFRHWKTGKIVRRPDGGVFPLRIRVKR